MAGNRWWNRPGEPSGDATPQSGHPSLRGWVQPMPQRPPAIPPAMPSSPPRSAAVPTPEPEPEPLPETVGIHPRTRIARLADELENDLTHPIYTDRQTRQFPLGVLASLQWALGQRKESPLTGKFFKRPPTGDEIGSEGTAATAALYGERKRPEGMAQGYVVGVEHACMWLRGETNRPPWFWADVESA